jgi:hypothetical protein
MPIISCPECGKRLKLNTSLPGGKRIQCPECSTRFVPGDGDDDRPARDDSRVSPGSAARERRPRDDFDFDDRRDRRPRDDDDRRDRRSRDDDDRDDRRGGRRRNDDAWDDDYDGRRPRRRAKKSSKALILWLCIGGGGALVAATVLIILLLVLGGSSHDSVMREIIALVNEGASVLESVKDRESAKAAAPKLNSIADRAEKLKKRAEALPQLSLEEQKRLIERFQADLMKAGQRAQKAAQQAQRNCGGEPTFQEALRRVERMDMR